MKKLLVLPAVCCLLPISVVFSQTLGDYVKQVKGDTLLIKDYAGMNDRSNSLYWALVLDTVSVPPGRVYELQAGGVYPLGTSHFTFPPTRSVTSSALHPTVIVGSDRTLVVSNKNASSPPPLICTFNLAFGWGQGIHAGGDLTIKNCALANTANDGRIGIQFTEVTAPKVHLVYDNCILEHTAHWFVQIAAACPNCNVTLRNCYLVNMNGQPCRRDGGVFDCLSNLDTLLVENCTHIMAQGSMYRFRIYPNNYQFKRIIINHNTFVNCAGSVFMNPGYRNDFSLTSNMFINCNIQAYPRIHSIDLYEQDPDWLPMGLVNVYPDSANVANQKKRTFLVMDNLAYWDPYLNDMTATLNANHVNGVTTWQSQMVLMNARTDSMFKHLGRFSAAAYLYLETDTWKNQLPDFADPQNLFATTIGGALHDLKAFALATVDTGSDVVLPDWRLINTCPGRRVNPDWPIPVDLSYSDANLRVAGIGKFPLGDLNWFPTQKATWLAQRDAELVRIENAMYNHYRVLGGSMLDDAVQPGTIQLEQNYPNPFNPGTTITYELPKAALVRLTVYDVLGREVQTLVNELKQPGRHEAVFNAGNLASGVYVYRLQAGSFVEARKLVLLR